jgi:hypothetical protein
MIRPSPILCVVCWGTIASGVVAAPKLFTPDGKVAEASLVSIDTEGQYGFEIASEKKTLSGGQMVKWGRFVESRGGAAILTVGGGRIAVNSTGLIGLHTEEDDLLVDTKLFGSIKIPLDHVVAVVRHSPRDAQRRDRRFADIRQGKKEADRVLLDNGDELIGTVLSLNIAAIEMVINDRPTKIEMKRVGAIALNPALLVKSASRRPTWIGFSDGTILPAATITGEKGEVRFRVAAKISLSAPLKSITAIQPSGEKVTYLSDLKPLSYRHIPYLTHAWPYHTDANALGGRLRSGGEVYLKGLGNHSASRLTYRLPHACHRFEAQLAVDEAAGDRGSVIYRVYTHAGKQWKLAYTSDVVRGGNAPITMSVDLTGAKAIALLVDFADRGDEQDLANWLDARLVK